MGRVWEPGMVEGNQGLIRKEWRRRGRPVIMWGGEGAGLKEKMEQEAF